MSKKTTKINNEEWALVNISIVNENIALFPDFDKNIPDDEVILFI